MIIETSPNPGKIKIDCLHCGQLYEVDDFRQNDWADMSDFLRQFYEQHRCCNTCAEQLQHEADMARQEARQAELQQTFPARLAESGLPEFYTHDRQTGVLLTVPPVRSSAEFFWRNRRRNLLLSGETGTGKSTGACFVASRMLQTGSRIRYRLLSTLLDEWREAKRSDHRNSTGNMLKFYLNLDVLIIDELVGKAKISESGQELLFYLLEAVYSGESKTRIWLLGNFYTGSIEDIFADGGPSRRRLAECFTCSRIDNRGNISDLEVYQCV